MLCRTTGHTISQQVHGVSLRGISIDPGSNKKQSAATGFLFSAVTPKQLQEAFMFINSSIIPMKSTPSFFARCKASRALRIHHFALAAAAALVLSACGGGGDAGPAGPVASSLSFPLKSAYAAAVASGYSKTYSVSGSCNGTATQTRGAASAGASFEGASGLLSAVETLTISFTNCTPVSTAATATSYYDTSYNPLGSSVVGTVYRVYPAALTIPSSVMVGSTGTIGTGNNYSNSTKTTLLGQTALSYVVEPDTATTAIVNLIARTYDAAGRLTSTEQDRYRIAATGAAVPVSIDIQYAFTSTTRLFLQ